MTLQIWSRLFCHCPMKSQNDYSKRIESLCWILILIFRHVDVYFQSEKDDVSIWIKCKFSLTLILKHAFSSFECNNIFERYLWTWTFIFSARKQSDCLTSFRCSVNFLLTFPFEFQDALCADYRLPDFHENYHRKKSSYFCQI